MSIGIAIAVVPYRFSISWTTSSHSSLLRLHITTVAPCEASNLHVSLPIPRPPPVTKATLFFRIIKSLLLNNWKYESQFPNICNYY